MGTHLNSLRLARRKDKLDRINNQLEHYYGPLYSLMKANHKAWLDFKGEHIRVALALDDPDIELTPEDIAAWRHWMKHIFMPANEKMFQIIASRSDLLIGDRMPKPFLELISHIVSYRAMMGKWPDEPCSELEDRESNLTHFNYPILAQKYVFRKFRELKKKQHQLLHE
ncbi:MAG: hypothetical protein U0176_10255 [Bacteroidia bacterium]